MRPHESLPPLRLRVVADADPSAIALVADRLGNLNVLPRRLTAALGINEILHITVDVMGVSEVQMTQIAGEIRECTPW
jgi:hypothetical protein